MREIAFLEIPGFGVNRLSWMGGRYAYLSAHFDGFTDHIFCIVDLKEITKPEIVSRWWLLGMHRAGGEKSTVLQGKRVALHHAIVAGDRAYGAWRDGGLTIHNISDPSSPKLVSHINWSPPFPGGTHTALPLPGRNLAVVADEANAEKCAKGTFLRDLQQRRCPHLRYQERVRTQGNRVVGAANAEEAHRPAAECRAGGEDGGHLRDDRRPDGCERLECGTERVAVRGIVNSHLPIPPPSRPETEARCGETSPEFVTHARQAAAGNYQPLPIPNSQELSTWALAVGRWEWLGVGSWELGIGR
jgi:hypothetical protein